MAPNRTTNEWTLWVVAAACAFHAAEEFLTGWQEWARTALGIVMPSGIFVAANGFLVLMAVLTARVGWRRPALSLLIPSATLVNAAVFHIAPAIVEGRAVPGLYTAVFLYLPFSSWALAGAIRDGAAPRTVGKAFAGGTLMMMSVFSAARLAGGAAG
ncbi:MAG TPA: HXXEE domain-containing protein [Bryobacteraceae bacterium]